MNGIQVTSAKVSFQRWGEQICPFDDLNFVIEPGEWVMLAGPNGSGKTTLMRAIAGTQPLDSGAITVWGQTPSKLTSARRAELIFPITQNPLAGTASELTAFENLFLAQDCPHLPHRTLRQQFTKLLESLGLGNTLDQRLSTLSGGQRQLLALTMASLRPAKVILLDEPLAALDPARTGLALNVIRSLWEAGKTIVQVTHAPELLLTQGTRSLILAGGTFIYDECNSKRDMEMMLQALHAGSLLYL